MNQTYRVHVCSCVLRTARELFAVPPFGYVVVHGISDLLNMETGHKEPGVIISALIPKTTYETLNFDGLEPVDCMRNIVHNMSFSRLRGFSSVNPVTGPTA